MATARATVEARTKKLFIVKCVKYYCIEVLEMEVLLGIEKRGCWRNWSCWRRTLLDVGNVRLINMDHHATLVKYDLFSGVRYHPFAL